MKGYAGEVLLVGINYDKNEKVKKHNCKIEHVIYSAGERRNQDGR